MADKVLKARRYKAGYEVRTVLVDGKQYGVKDFEVRRAYTPDGKHMGDPGMARILCRDRGIKQELSTPEHSVCSIGYSEIAGKWFGWSHRAIYGFRVGSKVKRGDCGYIPKTYKDFVAKVRLEYIGEMYKNVKIKRVAGGVLVTYEIHVQKTGKVIKMHSEHKRTKGGRGAWTAKTMVDAKQMAIDFAGGVS